ncbi:hypothetical protein LX64_03507 [Chitinophaga skermanii]|uniref:Lipoprotein n=1 Tax=Chitinophaga skermanii TaxID=331697 RepID=A0A327QD41_9BACT|nr:hypothetical protein [Chitinophaga skermanii]RAJ02489.1 hypothetical protein LX64_03507 [Chitinophaga skermanii]
MKLIQTLCCLLVVTLFIACNNSNSTGKKDNKKDSVLTPAVGEGEVKVKISGLEFDTQTVRINFTYKGQTKEKSFDLKVAGGIPENELYSMVWDQPNSAYVAVLKANRDTRYYHVYEEKGDLKILHHNSPPQPIWRYLEEEKGFGKSNARAAFVNTYDKELKSGNIISQFTADIRKTAKSDSVVFAYSYGGAEQFKGFQLSSHYIPVIRIDSQTHLVFGVKDGENFREIMDVWVDNGKLHAKQIAILTKR